ncbi:MAG: hypothetical protein JKY31_13965 [Rhodobacteraceae bacterium]|nr:hypothetical protein [Paracoccaceae bacterium]
MQPSDAAKPAIIPYFMPKWFAELLMGRLSFGDTFWAGVFGSMLLIIPAGFILAMGVSIAAPELFNGLMIGMMVFYALYMTLLLRVVLIKGWQCKTSGGWRWVGMGYTLLQTGGLYMMVTRLISAGAG